jgi:hypothetical protein
MSQNILFAITVLASIVDGRIHLLSTRGNIARRGGVLQPAAGLCFFALVVWGFATLEWYYVLTIIILSGLVSGLIVHPRLFLYWFKSAAILEFAILAATAVLWVAHWPL